jgi:hypothetical protein
LQAGGRELNEALREIERELNQPIEKARRDALTIPVCEV